MATDKEWIKDSLEICEGVTREIIDNVNIFVAHNTVNFPADTHVHEEYELMVVKRNDLPNVVWGDKVVEIPKQHGIMFNFFQRHGMKCATAVNQFICIAFPKQFVQEVMFNSFGGTQIEFDSAPFLITSYVEYLIGKLLDEGNIADNASKFSQNRLLQLIFIELVRCAKMKMNSSRKDSNISRAITYLKAHIRLPYDLDEAATVANLSPCYFTKQFKSVTGFSPSEYLTRLKIEEAQRLLTSTNKSNTEIAAELSFSTPSHFAQTFKKITGLTPSEYNITVIK